MSRWLLLVGATSAFLMAAGRSSSAQVPLSKTSSSARSGLYGGLTIGGGVTGMSDVNDDLRAIGLEKIGYGISYGGTVGSVYARRFGLSAHFRHYAASRSVESAIGAFDFRVPGNALYGSLDLLTDCPQTPGLCGFGISAGGIWTEGSVGLAVANEGCVYDEISAKGVYLDSHIVVITRLSSVLGLELRGGYRSAKAENAEVGGRPIYNEEGEAYSVSYSGVFLSAGITATVLGSGP